MERRIEEIIKKSSIIFPIISTLRRHDLEAITLYKTYTADDSCLCGSKTHRTLVRILYQSFTNTC